MVNSMTGFARRDGVAQDVVWAWEIKSVNGRGLEIRTRLPDGFDGLDQPVRKAISAALARGTVNVALKVSGESSKAAASLDASAATSALQAIATVQETAEQIGVGLAPTTAAQVLAMPGVMGGAGGAVLDEVLSAVRRDITPLLADLQAARASEGASLAGVLAGQIDRIDALLAEAVAILPDRHAHVARGLQASLAKVLENADGADPDRVAQELALLTVKSDVAEELDRLRAHIDAARDLLAQSGPIGRKFDFLTQEFNREANTLCSKANFQGLTSVGLELKTIIDQMREQGQNVG